MEDYEIRVTMQDNRPDDARGDGYPYCATVLAFNSKEWYNTGIVVWARTPTFAFKLAYVRFLDIHPEYAEKFFTFSNPVKSEELEEAYAKGMIRKKDLVDGKLYRGTCRNQTEATWHADKNRFTYLRTKFGQTFPEYINHPEDDDGFDFFCPYSEVL